MFFCFFTMLFLVKKPENNRYDKHNINVLGTNWFMSLRTQKLWSWCQSLLLWILYMTCGNIYCCICVLHCSVLINRNSTMLLITQQNSATKYLWLILPIIINNFFTCTIIYCCRASQLQYWHEGNSVPSAWKSRVKQ